MIKKEELKVGERATITLEVVEQDGCDGCFFGIGDICYNPTMNGLVDGFNCKSEDRSDGKGVIFKKVKKQKRKMKEDKVDAELPDIDALIKESTSDEFIEKKINDILGDNNVDSGKEG